MNNIPTNIFNLLQATRASSNPMQFLGNMIGSNPKMAQVSKLIQGKSPQQLRQTAENMAKQRGIDLNQLAAQMGLKLP